MKWQAPIVASAVLMLGASRAEKDDAKALQGAWVITESIYHGEAGAVDGMSRLIITGDRFRFENPGRDDITGTFTVDAAKGPKQIDMKVVEGPEMVKGKTGRGIYKIEGDTLKWAFTEVGDEGRPKGFADGEGPEIAVLQSFRREKP